VKSDSLIFEPVGGGGPYAEIADLIRAAATPQSGSVITPFGHAYIETIGLPASHIALEAMDDCGYFVPLAIVPLAPFSEQVSRGFRRQPLFSLSWYGQPNGPFA
jgi:hypothetical protein